MISLQYAAYFTTEYTESHGETWVPRSSLTLARAGQRAWIAMLLMFPQCPQPAQQMTLNSYRWNLISTVTCTGTGRPSFSAGLNFHFLTVVTALFSNAASSLRSTRTASTRPFALTPINNTTVPRGSASAGKSGNLGSGVEVALGGFMPAVTGGNPAKAGSSAGAVEIAEEASDCALVLCACAAADRKTREIASVIAEKRIRFPENGSLDFIRCGKFPPVPSNAAP